MSKPTLGYPSRTAAVMALSAEGKTIRQIAGLIGIAPSTVAALRHSARRSGKGDTIKMAMDGETLGGLTRAAAARGMRSPDLAARLLQAIVADDLFEAVLDEEVES